MVTEQDKTLEVLQAAIQMETDGKEYYLEISRESGNEVGKKLLQSLAAEEDSHRHKFEEIYNAIRNKKAWPVIAPRPDIGKNLRTIFAKETEEIGSNIEAPVTELAAVQVAMDMENKTYDFYKSQGGKAIYDAERNFYQSLAAEEKEHHAILLDYYEYLKDPAGYFVKKEHPSLDGG
ncbi:ferritin family protein [Chloroflexota bacterium]